MCSPFLPSFRLFFQALQLGKSRGHGILLRRLGMGRMPGDWRFRIGGREVTVPLGSSLVFSLVALLVARWL